MPPSINPQRDKAPQIEGLIIEPPEETDYFGVNARDNEQHIITDDTLSHVLANAHIRQKKRRINLWAGLTAEVLSVGPSFAKLTLPGQEINSNLAIAIGASTAIAGVFALRLAQNQRTLTKLARITQSYHHTLPDNASHYKRVYRSLRLSDIKIDETHKKEHESKQALERTLDQARIYGTEEGKKRRKNMSGLQRLKQTLGITAHAVKEIGTEVASVPVKLPEIFNNTVKGLKNSILTIPYAPRIFKNADAQNGLLYGMLLTTFGAEVAFETAHTLEAIKDISHDHYIAASLSVLSCLLAATPLGNLGREVTQDFNSLANKPTPIQDVQNTLRALYVTAQLESSSPGTTRFVERESSGQNNTPWIMLEDGQNATLIDSDPINDNKQITISPAEAEKALEL